jgi:hypothetical protein
MPRTFLQKQVGSARGDGWLDADWEATPSGNITVVTTTMKLVHAKDIFFRSRWPLSGLMAGWMLTGKPPPQVI